MAARWLASLAVLAAVLGTPTAGSATPRGLAAAPAATACIAPWPLWQGFRRHFVQPDGRVLDASTPRQHTSSEGQSYGMFFALVADDRETFARLWRWTVDNLSGGEPGRRLPAWYWGRRDDGSWGVLDDNSASDADLWLAYALFEAGARWRRDDYTRDARALLARIEADEVVDLPGLGKMLLPGRHSFVRPDHLWQLNPSYLPVPVLRRLALAAPDGPWNAIADNTLALTRAVAPHGFVADWVAYRGTSARSGVFVIDPLKGALGSYDAIRSYLWAGLTPVEDPLHAPMLAALDGMARATAATAVPPERVQTDTGTTASIGPFGFSAALVPYFLAKGQPWLADLQRRRVDPSLTEHLSGTPGQGVQPPYYDIVLSLFAIGWADGRYRFHRTGTVQLPETPCPRASTR